MRALLGLLLCLTLAACSGIGGPPEPTVNPNLPAPSPLTSLDDVVPAGEFGVARSTLPIASVLAIKVGAVRKGQAGDLKEYYSMNGGTDVLRNGIPYYANIHYAVLEGDAAANPIKRMGAYDSVSRLDPLVPILADDSELKEKCAEPMTDPEADDELRLEHVDCLVFVFESTTAVPDEILYGDSPEGDTEGELLRLAIGAIQ